MDNARWQLGHLQSRISGTRSRSQSGNSRIGAGPGAATVRSRAKLSYYAVDRYLSGQADDLMSHATPLEALYQVYRALRAHREKDELVMEDRREYRWILNDNKQIETIEPYEKLLSQKLVE